MNRQATALPLVAAALLAGAFSIGSFDTNGRFQNLGGTSAIGTGFDVPSVVPLVGSIIQPGSTWNFQLWYRDFDMGTATFNFSDGLSVLF